MKDIEDYRKLFPEYEEMFSDNEVLDEEVKRAAAKADEEVKKIDPSNLPDGFESDPKLYSFLKKYAYAKPPEHLKEKVMKAVFKNEYKPKTSNNINNTNSYWNPFLVQNPRPLMYSFVGLFVIVLATIAYYQYTKPSSPTNIIANQETPIIKVSPENNPANTPIVTPSPIQTISPDIAKSPENNNNNIRQDDTKENNQQTITKNDTKPRKPEEPKGLYKENDKISMNTEPKNISKTRGNSINKNNKNAASERLALSNLMYVAVMDLKIGKQEVNSIDVEIKEELIKAINENGKWELSSEQDDKTQAIFYKQNADGALVLFDKKERTPLWEDLNYIENYKKDKNYIKSIVKMLENHKGESSQKK